MSTPSPNHALLRTAPCVTAPASAAAFPPTVQVPRHAPPSPNLKSLGVATHIVRTKAFLIAVLFAFGVLPLFAADESPIVSPAISSNNSPNTIAAAKERGAATAAKDITAGTFRSLYYGKPWSVGRPLVDDDTGYRVQILEGCDVTTPFSAEVQAYNGAMREWHAKNKPATVPK